MLRRSHVAELRRWDILAEMKTNHANRGRNWERHLVQLHEHYAMREWATVFQTTPPTLRVGDGFRNVGVGAPDFVGVALGRPVLFDAKECSGKRWAFSNLVKRARRKGLPGSDHQARALQSWQDCGGLSFIVLRMGGQWGRGFVVPWSNLGPAWWQWRDARISGGPKSRASIDRDWCDVYAWPMKADGWIDWIREQGHD